MPIVVYHPTRNGLPVSARDPDVLETSEVGRVFRSRFNGKLRAEAWFDAEATRRVDNRVLDRLEAGEPIELSTGLYVEQIPEEGVHNGRAYAHVAVNYVPDHLAILPDQVGACSIADGCGVLVNASGGDWAYHAEPLANVLVTNSAIQGASMKLSDTDRQSVVAYLTANCDCWKGEGDAEILNRFSDEKLLALKGQTQAVVVANAAVGGFRDGDHAYRINPDTGKWQKQPVTNMGASKKDEDEDKDKDDEDEEYTKKEMKKRMADMASKSGKSSKTDNQAAPRKPKTLDELVKSGFLSTELQATITNAQQIEQREKDSLVGQLIVNVAEADRPAQRERLQRRSLDDLRNDLALVPKSPTAEEVNRATQAVANKRRPAFPPDDADGDILGLPTWNWQETSGPAEDKPASARVENVDITEMTEDDWLQSAPAHIRNKFNAAIAIESRERDKLIGELTANVADEDTERRLVARLRNKSLDELRDMLSLVPRQQAKPNYFGASAPLTNTRPAGADVNEDVLPLPAWNWAEESKRNQA